MKRSAAHLSSAGAGAPSPPGWSATATAVAAELANMCTIAAQLHNALGNQHYMCHNHPELEAALRHYQLASEMLLLAEEYRDPSSAACRGLLLDQNLAETSMAVAMDRIAELEAEHGRSVHLASAMQGPSIDTEDKQTTAAAPLGLALAAPPREQAAAVFYNLSLACVRLNPDREDEAAELLAMVEALCLEEEDTASEAKTPAAVAVGTGHAPLLTTKNTPIPCTAAAEDDETASSGSIDIPPPSKSVVTASETASCPTHSSSTLLSTEAVDFEDDLKDTGALLHVGKARAIRRRRHSNTDGGDDDKHDSAWPGGVPPRNRSSSSVPTVLPSHLWHGEEDGFGVDVDGKGGGKAAASRDGLEDPHGANDDDDDDDDDDDQLSQSSEPW